MVSPSATDTTWAGQEKQVAGIVRRKKRKVRREQRMQVSPLDCSGSNCVPYQHQEFNPGKITYPTEKSLLTSHIVAQYAEI